MSFYVKVCQKKKKNQVGMESFKLENIEHVIIIHLNIQK